MRRYHHWHTLLLFLASACFCCMCLGGMRDDLLAMLVQMQTQSTTISYGVSEEKQSVESFCKTLEAHLFTKKSSWALLQKQHTNYQSSHGQIPDDPVTMGQVFPNEQILLNKQDPITDLAMLRLLWYAATLKRPVVVLDMTALQDIGSEALLSGFYITADGYIQNGLTDQQLSKQTDLVNGAVILLRTGSLWSYIFRNDSQTDTYQMLLYIKVHLTQQYPEIFSARILNINPNPFITSNLCSVRYERSIHVSCSASDTSSEGHNFLLSPRGASLVNALYFKEKYLLKKNQTLTHSPEMSDVILHTEKMILSSKKPEVRAISKKLPMVQNSTDSQLLDNMLVTGPSGIDKDQHQDEPPQEKSASNNHSLQISNHSESTLAMGIKMAVFRRSVEEDYQKYLTHIHGMFDDEDNTMKHIRTIRPKLIILLKKLWETIQNPTESFDQQNLMETVADVYIQLDALLKSDQFPVENANFVDTIENWLNRILKHPLIILHRSNHSLWSDIIRTLSLLNEARDEYLRLLKGNEIEKKEIPFIFLGGESILEELTKLLENSTISDKKLFEDLQPFQNSIRSALTTLREHYSYLPPIYYPQIFQDLHSILSKHIDRITYAEAPYHPTLFLARKLIGAMIDKEVQISSENKQYSTEEGIEQAREAKKFFLGLFSSEQMTIAEEITTPGFFSATVASLVKKRKLISIAGTNLHNPHPILKALSFWPLKKNSATHSTPAEQQLLPQSGSILARRDTIPDVSQIEFVMKERARRGTVSLQLGANSWDIEQSKLLLSFLTLRENSVITFIKRPLCSRQLQKSYTDLHLKQQQHKALHGDGYISQTADRCNLVQQYLNAPDHTTVKRLPAPPSKVVQQLSLTCEPWTSSTHLALPAPTTLPTTKPK